MIRLCIAVKRSSFRTKALVILTHAVGNSTGWNSFLIEYREMRSFKIEEMKIIRLFTLSCQMYHLIPWILCLTESTALEDMYAKKEHLQVIVNQFPLSAVFRRNATGDIQSIEGVSLQILDWISIRYKFDYSLVAGTTTTVEDVGTKPGHITNMLKLKADVMIAAISPVPGRLAKLDLVHPWIFSPGAFLLPMPEGWQNNVDAVIKPFQPWVWFGLVMAAISIIVTLFCFNKLARNKRKLICNREKTGLKGVPFVSENLLMYVVGTLLNQGGHISCKVTKIRLVVGVWCLLTLVLVNVYNGILISFVTSVRPTPPLINSEEDVATDPNVHLLVNLGLAADIWFSTADKGLYKAYGDKLRTYSKSKCKSTAICVDLVKSLPLRHVYFHTLHSNLEVIRKEYQQTRECKLTMLVDTVNHPACWGLAKNSPHLENFNRGTLTLHEIGLVSLWEEWFLPDARPCLNNKHSHSVNKNEKKPLVRLSLDNLVGAFAVLIIGSTFSLIMFIIENIFVHWNKKKIMSV